MTCLELKPQLKIQPSHPSNRKHKQIYIHTSSASAH
ncbi:hypothetical protein IHE45_11G020000 [Dioscorea alata]|uniref:Uncharacterized protein n=1 Tax=Dioscorea alata TaxID=55571 RepID=A0ACB7V5A8_DIOAL|nr:hypothetical protein IHE45_11G020000 [Dioscorea alata]